MTCRVVVVGAGLGGLTAAVALHRRGWDVQVLERAPRLAPAGAGIALTPNALRCLDLLGVGNAVRERAAMQAGGGFREPGGRWLLRMDLAAVAQRLGDPILVLPRTELVDLLVAELPAERLRTGVTVTGVDAGRGDDVARVHSAAGDDQADVVVAADGAHSAVRRQLFPDPGLRYAGYTAWRLMAAQPPGEQFETWGRGQRFSVLPMSGGRVYAWATATTAPGGSEPDERAALLERFAGWHSPIGTVIAGTPAEAILRHDVVELAAPLPSYAVGRVALLGDAAHAMTPDLGQGGCMAIEDAVVLADQLGPPAAGRPIGEALAAYSEQRRPRASVVARQSRSIGRVGQARSPAAAAARTALVRGAALLPGRVLLRGVEPVAGWTPPGWAPR